MDEARYEAGLRQRRAVVGEKFVENALSSADDFNREFQELVTEYCFGICWSDETLSKKQWSLLNLGMLAALGRSQEFETHFKGALRNGCTRDELRAALMQIAIYGGIPAGVESFRIARRVLADWSDGEAESA